MNYLVKLMKIFIGLFIVLLAIPMFLYHTIVNSIKKLNTIYNGLYLHITRRK